MARYPSYIAACLALCLACHAGFVQASVHLWQIAELYSDTSRPLEFIELTTASAGQNLFKTGGNNSRLVSRTSGGQLHGTFTFPADVSTASTANHAVLIGTVNLSTVGTVTPDFIVPDGFLIPEGGKLEFVSDLFGTFASVTYPALPLGQNSYDVFLQSSVLNSPKNFSGVTGLVPLNNVWHHLPEPLDINADSLINALDVLLIVNELNERGTHTLELPPLTTSPPPYFDASGDTLVSPLDVLLVVNLINAQSFSLAGDNAESLSSLPTGFMVPEPPGVALAIVELLLLLAIGRSRRVG